MPRLRQLDRAKIRAYVAGRFSRARMVDDYLRVYEEVLRRHRARSSA